MWNTSDLVMGGVMTLLIIEYARKRHMPLFILNIVLILYAVYGYVVPGMFYHAGLSWERVITASSVEMATGIFSRLPQIALTIDRLVPAGVEPAARLRLRRFAAARDQARRLPLAARHPAVGGDRLDVRRHGERPGAANAITVGSATIPAMIAAGLPPATAAAIEIASSLGGQLMPPVMGIAAFLMAEFLGVDYFDVVARGWVPALDLLHDGRDLGLSAGDFLPHAHRHRPTSPRARLARHGQPRRLRLRGRRPGHPDGDHLPRADVRRALHVLRVGIGCSSITLSPLLRPGSGRCANSSRRSGRFLDAYMDMISDIALLLATLSIMTGALVITGVPTKLGSLLIEAAGVNIAAMVLMAFIFGAILGTGLPPAPTYILVAIVIAPPMIKAGVNPWVVHFFAFFLAVFGELTPPTSLVAAITAKIANASFYMTLYSARCRSACRCSR